MVLICECEHNRKNHEVGDRLNDRTVGACKDKDCKCKKYHHNKESNEKKNAIYSYCGLILLLIVVSSIGSYFIASYAIDNLSDMVDIKDKYIYKKYYLNGTAVLDDSKYTAKDSVLFGMKTVVGMIILSGSMFGSMFSISAIYDNRYRRLINE